MAKKVRLGFIGAGYMGQNAHIANYAKIDDCELVALAEGRPDTARAVADRYGIESVYPSHHELLADADVDGVVGVMGFHVLRWMVEDVLNAGEPITTELLRYGFRVTVLGFPAPALWTTPEGLAVVGPRAFGYDTDYTPLNL